MVVIYAVLIFLASSMSIPDDALPKIVNFDKFIHFTEFGILCLLIFWALLSHHKTETLSGKLHEDVYSVNIQTGRRTGLGIIALISILLTSFYGISDEFHQSFLSFRDSNVYDWLADAAGANIAGLSYMFIIKSRVTYELKIED